MIDFYKIIRNKVSMPLDQLKQLVKAIYPLTEKELDDFASVWQPFLAKRKALLTLAGQKENYLYFVVEGVQRVYYLDQQDREATLVFSYAPSFGGVVDSFLLQQPSRYYYETLTPSVFLRAAFPSLQAVMQRNPAVETMIRLGITHAMSGVLERLVEVQCYSSADRFRALLQRSSHILQLVPHKYLANYIGVDPTNFSKFINSIKS
ncbi:cAMP-binding domain of CRP or a regulatory subunit of cAMP-dependent protein kinases [Spirosoma endophyticum]|uniref:cAMP-binding domain of CRP or a regulatory subunit of cAMP-dependent protein kinases n=2 Tax=Spirosoma endophyticum TaxID=662367 RepID=A0A1I1HCN3_9BACT|nr:cAMP-binding domain of CRP or a regulatory subunit of cAMP-dependent protein kinases [Spirosoma endophyticum]